MHVQAMLTLRQDFPDIADEIIVAARSDAVLEEALLDYQQACERMIDEETQAGDRAQWAEVRVELVVEIRRRLEALGATPNKSDN